MLIQTLEREMKKQQNNLDDLKHRLKMSISISEINDAFDCLDPELALSCFKGVNFLLLHNTTWLQYAAEVGDRIVARLKAKSTNFIENNYGTINGNIGDQSFMLSNPLNKQSNHKVCTHKKILKKTHRF